MYNGFFDESTEAAPRIIISLDADDLAISRPATFPDNGEYIVLLAKNSDNSLDFAIALEKFTSAVLLFAVLGGGGGGVYAETGS